MRKVKFEYNKCDCELDCPCLDLFFKCPVCKKDVRSREFVDEYTEFPLVIKPSILDHRYKEKYCSCGVYFEISNMNDFDNKLVSYKKEQSDEKH